MDKQLREYLKHEISKRSRERCERGYGNCDPEYLTVRAEECFKIGLDEVGEALINFRDNVVNKMLGEGIPIERIEAAAISYFERFSK